VTMWTTGARIEGSQEAVDMDRRASGPLVFVLLLLVGPVGIWYAQHELNKVWQTQRASEAGPATLPEAPLAAQAAPAAPRP
jgi:hypothetical protein